MILLKDEAVTWHYFIYLLSFLRFNYHLVAFSCPHSSLLHLVVIIMTVSILLKLETNMDNMDAFILNQDVDLLSV